MGREEVDTVMLTTLWRILAVFYNDEKWALALKH